MKVFLTGATGFIGTRIIPELMGAGHTVLGLTRSEEGAKKLQAAGVEVHYGNIEDLDSLRKGAEKADGVIHCAMNHDFSQFVKNCEDDKNAIIAMGEVLVGSTRPFLVTSGTGVGSNGPGKLATEDRFDTEHPNPRIGSELAGAAATEKGVSVSVIRLPQVHDTVKQGLVTYTIAIAREKGFTAYLGEGKNRWPAAHVNDVARLYRLALEKNVAGSRYNAVAEEGITAKEIAEVTAKGLKQEVRSLTPEEAKEYFGWMAMFAGMDLSASSKLTQELLGWTPTGPGLIADLEAMKY
jgi:nucleoside-diphosphate-sugar epimerase